MARDQALRTAHYQDGSLRKACSNFGLPETLWLIASGVYLPQSHITVN